MKNGTNMGIIDCSATVIVQIAKDINRIHNQWVMSYGQVPWDGMVDTSRASDTVKSVLTNGHGRWVKHVG